ncbi:SLC13 family permease [Scatolibacter rhodanostii]|uniref:SLC13 family permease n=1 Tax=Scatolibacter rhodanostii TaxID=2014781 RepID=UPI000C06B7E3|nr:SLC13 family permease [Scatolibacter rhodanostii]
MELYIVLGITLFMIIMFVWHKVPFGVTTMTCCVLLVLTGIMDIPTAFSGFGNKIVVLLAPFMALSTVLSKTSVVTKISRLMNVAKGKHGMVLVISIFLVAAIFGQFIPATASIAIMVVFMSTLGASGEITPNRLILPLLGISSAFKFRIPIGNGATNFATINAMYEGIMPDGKYALTMIDPFLFSIIPMVVLAAYCLFAWRLMPKDGVVNTQAIEERKDAVAVYSRKQEIIIYVVFIAVTLCMILNKFTGDLMYLAPAVGVLVLIFTGVLKTQEAVKSMTIDMIWMIAGVLIVADALGKSGAGELIGNFLLSAIGENPSSFTVMLIFAAVTVITTNFLSNMATQAVFVPIAASIALAAGWDPRGIILICGIANMFDIAFPSGSGEAAVAYAAGGYNPFKVLKFTVPYMLLAILSSAISANLLYPIYG